MSEQIFWLVWSPTGTTPPQKRHDDDEAANLEAERLAREKPGHRFYVLRAERFSEVRRVETVELWPAASPPPPAATASTWEDCPAGEGCRDAVCLFRHPTPAVAPELVVSEPPSEPPPVELVRAVTSALTTWRSLEANRGRALVDHGELAPLGVVAGPGTELARWGEKIAPILRAARVGAVEGDPRQVYWHLLQDAFGFYLPPEEAERESHCGACIEGFCAKHQDIPF